MKRYIKSARVDSNLNTLVITSYDDFDKALDDYYFGHPDRQKHYLDITDAGYRDIADTLSDPDEMSSDMNNYSYTAADKLDPFLYYCRRFASNFNEIKKRLGEIFPVYAVQLNPELKSAALAAFTAMNVSVAKLGLPSVSSTIQTSQITFHIKHTRDYQAVTDAVVDAIESTGLAYDIIVNDVSSYVVVKAEWNKQ